MTETIDARGLACPQPVILTRKALLKSGQVITVVDNATARHNVSRMAEKEGCTVGVEENGDGIHLTIHREGTPEPEPSNSGEAGAPAGPLVLAVQEDSMGRGDCRTGSYSTTPVYGWLWKDRRCWRTWRCSQGKVLRSWPAAPALGILSSLTSWLSVRFPICMPLQKHFLAQGRL